MAPMLWEWGATGDFGPGGTGGGMTVARASRVDPTMAGS